MCKVFGLTNTSKIKDHKKLTDTILTAISKFERDGLGFEFVAKDGKRFGQRGTGDTLTFSIHKSKPTMMKFMKVDKESWGEYNRKTMGPAIFHSRTSTNNVSLKNTHPLRSQGISLIHNGVVTDHGPKYKMETTNDTEHILNYLRQENGLSKIEKNLTGYYACLALLPDNSLMIFRDGIAPLYTAYCKLNDTWIFSTSETIIEKIWKSMGWEEHLTDWYEVRENYCMVWKDNQLIAEQDIKPRGYGVKESKLASLSLHKELTNWDDTSYQGTGYETYDYTLGDITEDTEESLSFREAYFIEYMREVAEFGNSKYMIIDENGNEVFDITKCTDKQLLGFSLLDNDGNSIDLTNFS